MKTGICKLCGEQRCLIRKSHIIPNFMYSDILGNQNRMLLQPLKEGKDTARYVQTGLFEKNILCQNCDNVIFGTLERYAAGVLYGKSTKEMPVITKAVSNDKIRFLDIDKVEYEKFKLFILSVLWRAHISQHKFFSKVDIRNNETEIRNRLLSGVVGVDDDFRISLLAVESRHGGIVKLSLDPEVKEIGEGSFATFFIAGIAYFIDLKPASNFEMFRHFPLFQAGNIRIPILQGGMAHGFLTGLGLPEKLTDYYADLNDN